MNIQQKLMAVTEEILDEIDNSKNSDEYVKKAGDYLDESLRILMSAGAVLSENEEHYSLFKKCAIQYISSINYDGINIVDQLH